VLLQGGTDTVKVPDIAAIKWRQDRAEREERHRREAGRARLSTDADRKVYAHRRIDDCVAAIKTATEASGRHSTYLKQAATAKALCDRYNVEWAPVKGQLVHAYGSLFSGTDANRRRKGSTEGVLAWIEGRAG
jgi:hypothetical protein